MRNAPSQGRNVEPWLMMELAAAFLVKGREPPAKHDTAYPRWAWCRGRSSVQGCAIEPNGSLVGSGLHAAPVIWTVVSLFRGRRGMEKDCVLGDLFQEMFRRDVEQNGKFAKFAQKGRG